MAGERQRRDAIWNPDDEGADWKETTGPDTDKIWRRNCGVVISDEEERNFIARDGGEVLYISEVLGNPKTREEVMQEIFSNQKVYAVFERLNADFKEQFVEFESGELADVEIQKFGFAFPGERASCYSADMIMRQYERQNSLKKDDFTYRDMKHVYTIVFMENSSEEFYFVSLDIFFSIEHNENKETLNNELEAWLYFLGSDRIQDIMCIVHSYLQFVELYQDICKFRYLPEEAVMMFSDALRKLDENTVLYKIDEMKRELEAKDKELEEQKKEIKKLKRDI